MYFKIPNNDNSIITGLVEFVMPLPSRRDWKVQYSNNWAVCDQTRSREKNPSDLVCAMSFVTLDMSLQ